MSLQLVKDRFLLAKAALIRELGNQPLDDVVINKIGKREFGVRWAGVFAADQAKKLPSLRDRFAVLNTGKADGPGYHWLAIHVSPRGVVHVYDSFGRDADRVAWRLSRAVRSQGSELKTTDPAAEQKGSSAVCGHLSLAWLLAVRDHGIRAASQAV
jgi:hypothetical protein